MVAHLKLEKLNYMPYSLRRGAATSAYREGMGFDQLLSKGRWQHIATARLYLDQALQELAAISIPMESEPSFAQPDASFCLPSKSRVEEGVWWLLELGFSGGTLPVWGKMSSSLGRCLAIVQLALDPGILYKKAALFGGQEGEGTIAHVFSRGVACVRSLFDR